MGSLFKSRITNSAELVERPQTREYKVTGQAVRANVTMKTLLWGCPGMNFKVTLPFPIMRQVYAAFEKRPHALTALFRSTKVLQKNIFLYTKTSNKDDLVKGYVMPRYGTVTETILLS